ncbi:MAG TPA: hypothetical protein VGR16_09295 [Thermomicrobiales bacterium]|nr:hypothetical protein [Thermomicrobiales bacterium]
MAEHDLLIDEAPLQDRDLLQRLSLYFDALDTRLRQGQGWFIFNAASGRSGRITSFIEHRIGASTTEVSAVFLPWRDFALSAYVREVGLPELAPTAFSGDDRKRREFNLASQLTRDAQEKMISAELLILAGLRPAHHHEARVLDETLETRYRQRLATIVLTPDMPQTLEAEFSTVDPSRTYWNRLYQRMYETSLVAI